MSVIFFATFASKFPFLNPFEQQNRNFLSKKMQTHLSPKLAADLHRQPIVALATPSGMGAIGIIRLSGEGAIEIADYVFKGKKLSRQPSHTVHFGKIIDGDTIIDEVLISIFRSPHSYTGQDTVEISCHGSPYILQRVMTLLVSKGAQPAKAGEFTMRAFLNGKMDLSQAEAVADLIASENAAMHRVALQQMRGGFSALLGQLREQLVNFTALIELELDFSTEDVAFADRQQLLDLIEQLDQLLNNLITSFSMGNVIKNGIVTVIAGRPNAGKSTLLNVLLNEERAIVSPIAGTTRDTIEEVLHLDGIAFRLVDTAGIRQATDAIEQIGVAKTREKIERATLLLYVFDANTMSANDVAHDLAEWHQKGLKIIAVGNKTDEWGMDETKNAQHFKHLFPDENYLPISAKTHSGLAHLRNTLLQAAGKEQISLQSNQTLLTNVRHYNALQQAQIALQQVRAAIYNNTSGELLSLDLRVALEHLGQITGHSITSDEVLGAIFSRFCIGK